MRQAIELANEGGGKLCRYSGGFWSVPGKEDVNWMSVFCQEPHVGAGTIQALVNRGMAEYTDWRMSAGRSFEVEITLTAEAGAQQVG